MEGKLKINSTNFRNLNELIADIIISIGDEKLEDIVKRHRRLDKKKIFFNSDDFNFISKENNGVEILDPDLEKVIDDFMRKLKTTSYTLKKRNSK